MDMKFDNLLTMTEAAAFVGINYQSFMNQYKKKGVRYSVWYGHPLFDKDCVVLHRWKESARHYLNGGKPEHEKVSIASAIQTTQDVIDKAASSNYAAERAAS